MKSEKLEFLADNTGFTKRFAITVGRLCRHMPIQDVAQLMNLNWHTTKNLEKQYMQMQLDAAPEVKPNVVGIDEISRRKGHDYRIIVSDIERGRAIWYGGEDRSEKSMDMFYAWLGPEKSASIAIAVMDMWKAFSKSTRKNAPQASILFDKFHVLRHLNDALDKVRKREYRQMSGEERKYIKGTRYILLSRHENLDNDGRKNLKALFKVNKRLNTAYMLKESFAQLWDYESSGWARRFFEKWKESLKWQRLKPFEKFAKMIERNWDGVAAYCDAEKKVALGFVEGLNNKIRVIQRRAYGLRDEEYLRLKILTCMLPEL